MKRISFLKEKAEKKFLLRQPNEWRQKIILGDLKNLKIWKSTDDNNEWRR